MVLITKINKKILSDQVLRSRWPLRNWSFVAFCGFILLFFLKRWACSTLPCAIFECFTCYFKLNIVPRIGICRIQQGHVHSVSVDPNCLDKLRLCGLFLGHIQTVRKCKRWCNFIFCVTTQSSSEDIFQVSLWFFVSRAWVTASSRTLHRSLILRLSCSFNFLAYLFVHSLKWNSPWLAFFQHIWTNNSF